MVRLCNYVLLYSHIYYEGDISSLEVLLREIKLGFGIKEMCNLTGFDKYKMSKIRRQLLQKVYQKDGSSSDFDHLVRKIMSVALF